ncbi:hypothetical protein [Iningainema tapete]|uniref:Uncharacterized protein n=1 Tax=Iningainema tapete BLCC-T55 TaxID=2748662 RepID=A0A8J6XAC5_9CYAN|nr:hypothetical protein [Iningainema tapete]MBD2770664.1 hypothetical protein [Iningainema tapete BLCC-T55]
MTDTSLLKPGKKYQYRHKTLTYSRRGDDARGKFTYIFKGARGGEIKLSERAVYREVFELEPEQLHMSDGVRELIKTNSDNKLKALDLNQLESFNYQ